MSTKREEFETIFSKPPYEFDMARFDALSAWPGNYRDYHCQCAWDGWQEARAALASAPATPATPAGEAKGRTNCTFPNCHGDQPDEEGECCKSPFTYAMADAAERYFQSMGPNAYPLPAQFRWSDCFRAMIDAAPAATQPAVNESVAVRALRIAHGHIDMDALRISHCKDAAAIDEALASAPVGDGSATQPAWPMKDHELRELVNALRDVAIKYHGTQQLRERIAQVVHPWARPTQPAGEEAHPDTVRLDWLLLNSEFNPETTTYFWNSPDERKASGRAEIDAARAAQAGGGK